MLIIGTFSVPIHAELGIVQAYETLSASTVHRVGPSGTAKRQTLWTGKLRTRISSDGWAPPGLSGIDASEPLAIHCIAPLSKTGGTTGINIGPAAKRRADSGFAPIAFGVVGTELTETGLVVASNGDCTITAVSGATTYLVKWFPILTCYVTPPQESLDAAAGVSAWEITGEEV